MLRRKKLDFFDFLHGSVRRYKTLRSSTNCGCGHLMPCGNCNSPTVHSHSIYMAKWGVLLIVVVPAPGAAVDYKLSGPQGNKAIRKGPRN